MSQVMREDNRIEWIDIYKGVLILLVIVGYATGLFNAWIYQFHMAAFFFVSGFLSSSNFRNCLSSVIRKFLNIMLPFVSLGLFGAIINEIIYNSGNYELLFDIPYIGFAETLSELFSMGKTISNI